MTNPSPYQPTSSAPKRKAPTFSYWFNDNRELVQSFDAEKFLNYAVNGNSYIGPMFSLPSGYYYNDQGFDELTYNGDLDEMIYYFRYLQNGKRCVGMNFANVGPHGFHIDDNIIPENFAGASAIGLGFTYGVYLSSRGTTTIYGYPSLWPDNGITQGREFWTQWVQYLKDQEVILDAVMFAQEGNRYGAMGGTLENFMNVYPQARESWHGLTSFYGIFEEQTYPPYFRGSVWYRAGNAYIHKAMDLAYGEPYLSRYPEGVMGNYGSWNADSYGNANHGFEDNIGQGAAYGLVGNASSPSLYGPIRLFDRETLPWSAVINYLDPYTGAGLQHHLDQHTTTGAWLSFFTSMTEMRMIKRNAYNNPIAPWIANVSMSNLEYNIWGLSRETLYQAPKEVLHDTWYRKNMSDIVYGYAGSIGFVRQDPFSGYYGVIPGHTAPDGSTSAMRLDTTINFFTPPIANAKCELRYYYNGLCAGNTYLFSYYINLGTGYTDNNINFTTYDDPNRTNSNLFVPSYSGLTYKQILPLETGLTNGENKIYYNAGDSGWTKVQWEFYPDGNNTTANIYLYSVTNGPGTDPRQTFIWDIKLEQKSSPTNINIPITPPYIETERVWRQGPPMGMADVKKGYNPKQAAYFTKRGGNSGYYYEMIRHCCLLGSKGFPYFNKTKFIDHSIPGTISVGILGSGTYSGAKEQIYYKSGKTGFLKEFSDLDSCLKDVHSRIGGFTLSTANAGYLNWRLPYVANAAPDITGNTWWWRVTVKPGFTMNCHGITLHAPNKLGAWIPLNSSDEDDLMQGITWQEWPRHPKFPESFEFRTSNGITFYNPIEPSLPSPTKEFNFSGVTSLLSLTSIGFTFFRGSCGSYIDSNGLLKIAGNNQPRVTYDPITKQVEGMLMERASTNELCWSETFGTTGGSANNWQDLNIIRQTGFMSPSGLTNAIRFRAAQNDATIKSTQPRPSGTRRAFSIWARGITGNEKLFYTVDGGTHWIRFLDLKKEWKRYNFHAEYQDKKAPYWYGVTIPSHHIGFKIGKQNQEVELWGAQLEPVSQFANRGSSQVISSYIPTSGLTASRAEDRCEISGFSLTNWLGQTAGTFIFDQRENMCPYFDTNNNFNFSTYFEFWTHNIATQIRGKEFATTDYKYGPAYVWWNGIFPVNSNIKTLFAYSPTGITLSHGIHQWGYTYAAEYTLTNWGTYNRYSLNWPNAGYSGVVRKLRYWNYTLDDALMSSVAKSELPDPYQLVWNPYDTDVD